MCISGRLNSPGFAGTPLFGCIPAFEKARFGIRIRESKRRPLEVTRMLKSGRCPTAPGSHLPGCRKEATSPIKAE